MSSLLTAVIVPASIPSPSQGVWHLFGLPIRAYALCILAGIFAGYWLGKRRWVARGGSAEVIADVVMWAVPFGLIGARIYHVVTDAELYFGEGRNPVDALKIWNGGLGVWGAIGFGILGAWLACRRHKVPLPAAIDAFAPAFALAQILGRFGNYFNQELFGKPTDRPWGLEISPEHRPSGYADFATFHPTFLYEALWNVGVVALVIWAGRRFQLGHGRSFALYVAAYCVGRAWIENLRIDPVNTFLGLRLNVWTSIILFVLAVGYIVVSAKLRPGVEDLTPRPADTTKPSDSTGTQDTGPTGDAGDSSGATGGAGGDAAGAGGVATGGSSGAPAAGDGAPAAGDGEPVAGGVAGSESPAERPRD